MPARLPVLPPLATALACVAIGQAEPAVLRSESGIEATFTEAAGRYRWTGYADSATGREWRLGGPRFSVETDEDRRTSLGDAGCAHLVASGDHIRLETVLPDLALEARQEFSFCLDGRTLRIRTFLRSNGAAVRVQRVGLLDLQVSGQDFRLMGPEFVSSPVFGDRVFAGVEHPSAQCRVAGSSFAIAQPLHTTVGRDWTELPGAVFGSAAEDDVATAGDEALRRAFLRYLDTVRVKPTDLHVHYNDWWTAPVPSSGQFVLRNLAELKASLYDRTGFFFDSYALDAGWSDPKSLWEIDPGQFPERFGPIAAALAAVGSRVGLWISPSSLYPFALDNHWLASAGYEATPHAGLGYNACLARGGKYQTAFKQAALRHAREANLAHLKFDGFVPRCDVAGHGHPVGDDSYLPIAEGLIEVFDALRAQNHGIALEPTCFGYQPSPWWLMHVPFIIGPFGDDSPYGRCPAPDYLEAMTTAREIKNLEGRSSFLMPSSALQCFDVIVQCPGAVQNHAVMAIGRGRWFISSYIECTVFAPDPPALGPSWTSPDGTQDRRTNLVVQGRLTVSNALNGQLCVLCEGDPAVADNACRIVLNGRDAVVSVSKSQGAFGAAGEGVKEHWIWFLADVPVGEHEVRIEVSDPALHCPAGVFLRGDVAALAPAATPFDDGPGFPAYRADRIPWSRMLVPVVAKAADPARTKTASRRTERIDGIYLDALGWADARFLR